jgi:hypothetical protein
MFPSLDIPVSWAGCWARTISRQRLAATGKTSVGVGRYDAFST